MKEDILEQITADYLNTKGYFTLSNIKYKPDKNDRDWNGMEDGVNSDIDVLGFNPRKRGSKRVIAVSCKSWQGGFFASVELNSISKKKIFSSRVCMKLCRLIFKIVQVECSRKSDCETCINYIN